MRTVRETGGQGAVVRVGLVYLCTAFALFLIMGLFGLLMRLQSAGLQVLSLDWFYRLMTLHGSGMVAASLLAGLGGLAAALSGSVPLSPRWLWTAFVIYVLGAGFVTLATLLGGFAAGWTVLPPLPYEGRTWGLWAGLAAYFGYLCVAVGLAIYCWHLLTALVTTHGGLGRALAWRYLFSGGRHSADPLPSLTHLVGAVIAIDGLATTVAGAVILLPLLAHGIGLIGRVDALFAKNMIFLFGHTLANLAIYVGAGLVYATVPRLTGREWKTSWLVVLAWNLVIVFVLTNYSHHLYQDFAQPLPLELLGQVVSYAVGVPSLLVTIFGALRHFYRSGLRWSVPAILIVVGLWGWVFGGLGAVLDSTVALNQVLHNTLWVPAHFHTYYLLGAVAFGWAYLYFLLADLSGRSEARLSRLAAWLYGVGGTGFVLAFFFAGANGVPRRYAVHLPAWHIFAQVSVPFVLILAAGVAWLGVEMLTRLGSAWRATSESAASLAGDGRLVGR